MIRIVADASVAVKWVLPERREEDDDAALDLFTAIRNGRVELLQPVHWLLEVAAVVIRLRPDAAARALALLDALDVDTDREPETLQLACDLATRLRHHLFDALYHAVALRADAQLVTADAAYYRKACGLGGIRMLGEAPELFGG